MEKEFTVQNNKDRWIWKRPGAYKVLKLMKEGESIPEIAKEVKWKEDTVWNFISSPTFLRKFNTHLKCVFFEFQKNKILAMQELSRLFWDIITGRKKSEDITPDKACEHLIKLLKIHQGLKITNPQGFNIITGISETSEPEEPEDLAKIFGYEGLEVSEEEKLEAERQLNN